MADKTPAEPTLLSGGNPQIPSGEGDAPVQASIAAMPGWKSGVRARPDPMPPVASKSGDTRYFHIHEGDAIDDALFAGWLRQASALPGAKM